MADTLSLACPECDKKITVPAEAEGKKIRCKKCGHTFVAKAPGGKKAGTDKKAAIKKAADKVPSPSSDEGDDVNPYLLGQDEGLKARCPHCASELRSADDIVCLSCGYNTITRTRHETKLTKERTRGDWAKWLMPGIICVLFVLCCGGFDLTYIFFLGRWLDTRIFGEEITFFNWRAFKFWGTVISLFFIFFAARFAFKRLILHPTPPEVQMKMKKKDED